MNIEKSIFEKTVTVTNQGMITIPAAFRKSFGLKDGDKVLVVEDEGSLKLIPLKIEEEIRKNTYTKAELLNQMKKSKKEDITKEL
jgi:AbrB family looped-hinge helix DNA binding protein